MAKKMQNLPEGMIPDRDNVVYYENLQWKNSTLKRQKVNIRKVDGLI